MIERALSKERSISSGNIYSNYFHQTHSWNYAILKTNKPDGRCRVKDKLTGDLFLGTEFERKEDFDPVKEHRELLQDIDVEARVTVRVTCSNGKDSGDIIVCENSIVALSELINKLKKVKK